MTLRWTLLFALGLGAAVSTAPAATDTAWPQWRGPNRNGLSSDTGLLKQWPSAGPPQVWSANGLGAGYGSVAMTADRIFVQGARGGKSVINVLDRASGKAIGPRRSAPADPTTAVRAARHADARRRPRLRPHREGDFRLPQGGNGTEVWQRNILRDFGGPQIPWLISESPLVDGGNVIVTPGGPRAGIVALDKMTGKTVWTSQQLSDPAGYASPIAADVRRRPRLHDSDVATPASACARPTAG